MKKETTITILIRGIRIKKLLILINLCLFIEFLSALEVNGQTQQITGKITDASTSETIIGATVQIEGTTIGCVSDKNGKFSLDVPKPDAVILISYVGYTPERIILNGQSNFDIKLVPDLIKLSEIVVIGYGSMKKSDVTGAVVSVNGEKLKKSV